MAVKPLLIGIGIIIFLALPPMVSLLESSMVGHMLIQIPALIIGGIFLGQALRKKRSKRLVKSDINAWGIPGLLLAVFVFAFWMLPRSLDGALDDPVMEILKFASLPLLVGIPLALSWRRWNMVTRSFLWAKVVSMMAIMSMLYLHAPDRLCNNYLLYQQELLGQSMFGLAAVVFLGGMGTAFIGVKPKQSSDSDTTTNRSTFDS